MTVRDRLLSFLGFQPSKDSIEGALADQGIADPTVIYSSLQRRAVLLAAIEVIQQLLTTANTNNSVTGFGITYDRAAVAKRLEWLENEVGTGSALPRITGLNKW